MFIFTSYHVTKSLPFSQTKTYYFLLFILNAVSLIFFLFFKIGSPRVGPGETTPIPGWMS